MYVHLSTAKLEYLYIQPKFSIAKNSQKDQAGKRLSSGENHV